MTPLVETTKNWEPSGLASTATGAAATVSGAESRNGLSVKTGIAVPDGPAGRTNTAPASIGVTAQANSAAHMATRWIPLMKASQT